MPATKSKSKVTRTLRRKGCEKCYQRAVQRLDLACKLERAEFERDEFKQRFSEASWELVRLIYAGRNGEGAGAGEHRHSP